MANNLVILSFVLVAVTALVVSLPHKNVSPQQEAPLCPSDTTLCGLPDCRCASTAVPGGFSRLSTPQIVFLTFDDAITVRNFPLYEELFDGRTNPNGAPISATFFIIHENTNYSMVHELWRKGHEIALHSITHTTTTQYWANMNESMWNAEVIQQRAQVANFARIDADSIRGMRAPFLQIGGNTMYAAMSASGGLDWECSRPTQNFRAPGLWPYTNDFASIQDCQIGPCPDASFPGFWTMPMIDLIGDDGFPCAMADECTPVPQTQAAMYNLLHRNFQEQYTNNRAPFGIYIHSAWLQGEDPDFAERVNGYTQFLDYLDSLNDVFIVGVSQGLEWVKNPVDVLNIATFDPWKERPVPPNNCPFPRNCRYENGTWEKYMSSCVPCPSNYPWVHNPMGL